MARRSQALVPAVQAVASLLILVLLVRQTELDAVRQAFSKASLGWLALAAFLKALGLTLHELRIWVSLLPANRRSVWAIVQLGYAAALVNTVLPLRSGDMFAIVLLRQEQRVPTGAAISAVGLTAMLEIFAFGVFLLGVLIIGAAQFDELLGTANATRATNAAAGLALGSMLVAAAAVLVARRLGQEPRDPGTGFVHGVRNALRSAADHLQRPALALGNLTLAAGQVVSLVLIFWCLLPAVGATPAAPLLAVAGILAVGSLASLVLPPSLGAAPAAVSVFVLGFFGVSEAQSLAYGALTWVVNVVPALVLGVVPLWGRLGRLGETLGGDERPLPEECPTSASRSSRPG